MVCPCRWSDGCTSRAQRGWRRQRASCEMLWQMSRAARQTCRSVGQHRQRTQQPQPQSFKERDRQALGFSRWVGLNSRAVRCPAPAGALPRLPGEAGKQPWAPTCVMCTMRSGRGVSPRRRGFQPLCAQPALHHTFTARRLGRSRSGVARRAARRLETRQPPLPRRQRVCSAPQHPARRSPPGAGSASARAR